MPRLNPFYVIRRDDWWLTPVLKVSRTGSKARSDSEMATEEYVRQWVLRELVETYRYPQEWVGRRIVFDREIKGEGDQLIADICILTASGDPFIVIEVTTEGSRDEAEAKLRTILTECQAATMGMITDGTPHGTRFLRMRTGPVRFDYIPDIEEYSLEGAGKKYFAIASEATDAIPDDMPLAPLSDRIEDLLFEAHSHIRDIDGMHADEALDEICKVLLAKLYDEEHLDRNGRPRLQRVLYSNTEDFAASARVIYGKASEYYRGASDKRPLDSAESHSAFSVGINLSSPALAKVVEMLQGYHIGKSGIDVRGRAFQRMLEPAIRAGMGQYITPEVVTQFMASVANPGMDDVILDPFCGSAGFLIASLQHVREKCEPMTEKDIIAFASEKLHGIDKSERMVRLAITAMLFQGDGHTNIRDADALLPFENYPDIQPESFDIVLTNPPFGSVLRGEALRRLGPFELAKGERTVALEILGLERSVQFLRPGGRLGIVLPDGILVNKSNRFVREWLDSQVKVRGIVSLPIEAFAPFGATVKTSLLFARKWKHNESRTSDYDVFLAQIGNIGFDFTGRAKDGQELDRARDELLGFLEEHGW